MEREEVSGTFRGPTSKVSPEYEKGNVAPFTFTLLGAAVTPSTVMLSQAKDVGYPLTITFDCTCPALLLYEALKSKYRYAEDETEVRLSPSSQNRFPEA